MLFIILAFLFDMFKWATFLVSASVETSFLSSFEGEKLLARRNKQLKITFFTIQGIIAGIFLYSFVQCLFLIGDFNSFLKFATIRNTMLAVISFIILVLYILIFSFLKIRLKNYYPHYYIKHRKALLTLFIAITVSIVVRTVFVTVFCFSYINKQIY